MLDALEVAKKDIEYFALDLSLPELERTFAMLDIEAYQHVSFRGLHGTYDDALSWLKNRPNNSVDGSTTCIMTLGSSIGNFTPDEATNFLKGYARILGPADLILVGLDACQDPKRIFRAYNDSKHVTERFYRNGLEHANRLLGYQAFKQEDWKVGTAVDERLNKHWASYVALKDIKTKDLSFRAGEVIPFEEAWKFSEERSDKLWRESGLIHKMAYANFKGDYSELEDLARRAYLIDASADIHLLSPAHLEFKGKPQEYAPSPVPSLSEWRELWAAWDTATKAMIPKDELLNKPIKLRNDLIFYLGHIPAFAGECNPDGRW